MSLFRRVALIVPRTAREPRSPRARFNRHGVSLAALLAMALALPLAIGCAGSGADRPNVSAAPPELTSDGLEMVESTRRTRLWVKPDHHIGRYDNVLVSGIGFQYAKGQDPLSDEQEAELGEMLKKAIASITESGPVGQSSQAGPCVVALQVGLRDLVLHTSDKPSGSSISYVTSFGSATMIVEFRDSTTDVPLVRYAANRGLGGGPGTGQVGANMTRLGRTLGEMMTDMTTELQTIVPDTTVRPETECNEGIYKLTGRG